MFRYIEMMGCPAAGKSTFAPRFLGSLKELGFRPYHKSEALDVANKRNDDGVIRNFCKIFPKTIWQPLSGVHIRLPQLHQFAYKHLEVFSQIVYFVQTHITSKIVRECILYNLFLYAAEHELLSKNFHESEMVLAEEGFCQLLSMTFGYLQSGLIPEDQIRQAVASLPSINVVIWVQVPLDECIGRLRQRPVLPLVLQSCDDYLLEMRLRQVQQSFTIIAEELERRDCRVIKVSGSIDLVDSGSINSIANNIMMS